MMTGMGGSTSCSEESMGLADSDDDDVDKEKEMKMRNHDLPHLFYSQSTNLP